MNNFHQSQKNNNREDISTMMFYLSTFKRNDFLKPFLTLCLVFCIFLNWGGFPCFSFYMNQILMDVKVPVKENTASAFIYGFRTVTILIANTMIYRFKMRTVFFSTAICHMILVACLALYCFLNKDGVVTSLYPGAAWTPVICILLMFSTSAVGCNNIVWSLTGMLLPSYARTFGAGMVGILDYFSIVLLSILLPTMIERIGWHGIFFTCFICCAVSVEVLWFALPETTGKTLEEIEQAYRTNGASDENNSSMAVKDEETK